MATRRKIPLIDASATLDVTGTVTIAGSGSAVITFPASTSTLETTTGSQAKADAKVEDSITDAHTTVAPSGNAVFDALALKAPLASPTLTGTPATPTATAGDSTTQIASTAFVQQAVRSVPSKEASEYATTAALPTVVYSNGTAGVGATLTGVAMGAIGIDSGSPSVGQRILVKNQVSTFQNGIYDVTATGSGIAVFVLTRSLDFNQTGDIKTGATTYVVSGTVLAATTWDVNSADSPVMGTDAITFIQSAGPGSLIAGTGIGISGVTVAIDTSVTVDKTTAQTLTNKTLTAPKFADGGYIADANSNELLEFGVTASAVNHVKVSNKATNNFPIIEAVGGDANIDLLLGGKGAGIVSAKRSSIYYPVIINADKLSALSATTSAELAGVISDETGSGALVFATSPTLITPALGTPASGVMTNVTGLPSEGLTSTISFKVYRGTAQAAAIGLDLVEFNTEVHDTGADYNTGTFKFVAPIAGIYHFNWMLNWTAMGGQKWASYLYKGGAACASGDFFAAACDAGGDSTSGGAVDMKLAANDEIQVYSYLQTAGRNISADVTRSWFAGHFVGVA